MTPIPPRRASVMAIRDSVTVSIAADTIGTAKRMSGVNHAEVSASCGSTADSAGSSSTSSNVKPSRPKRAVNSGSSPASGPYESEREAMPKVTVVGMVVSPPGPVAVGGPPSSRNPLRWALVAAGFVAVAVATHWRTLDGYFVSDDFEELLGASGDGPRITTETHPGRNLRPINQWLHRWSVEWFGRDPVPQHWVSLAIHVVVALMVVAAALAFLAWLERARGPEAVPLVDSNRRAVFAVGAGGLFLVHPSHTEAVSWISARSDLLMSLGAVATLICWWRPAHRGVRWTVAAAVGFCVALASKEPAVGLPTMLAALEAMRVVLTSGRWRAALRAACSTWPLWLVLVPYALARQFMLGTTKSGSWREEFLGTSAPLVVARGAKLVARTVAPAMPLVGWVIASVLVGIGIVVLVLRRRNLGEQARFVVGLTIGVLVAVALQYAPVARLGASLHHSGGERFTYFPGVLASMLVALGAAMSVPARAARWTPVVLIALGAVALAPAQQRWAESAALSGDLVRSEIAMPRDEPVVVINLADLLAGSLLGRNALGHDLEFVHSWQGPAPVEAVATYDAGAPGNRVAVRVLGNTVRLDLIEPGAKVLELSGPDGSWIVPGATARQRGPRSIDVTFDRNIRRRGVDGRWVWPSIWVAEGRAYRRVVIDLARVAAGT